MTASSFLSASAFKVLILLFEYDACRRWIFPICLVPNQIAFWAVGLYWMVDNDFWFSSYVSFDFSAVYPDRLNHANNFMQSPVSLYCIYPLNRETEEWLNNWLQYEQLIIKHVMWSFLFVFKLSSSSLKTDSALTRKLLEVWWDSFCLF